MYGNDRQSDDCEAAVGVGGHTCCDCPQCRASKEAVNNYSEREYDSNFDGIEHSPDYQKLEKGMQKAGFKLHKWAELGYEQEFIKLDMESFLNRTKLAILVEFDKNYEPLWVPKSQIMGFSESDKTIKVKAVFFHEQLKPKRKLKQPLAGQDLVKNYLSTEDKIPNPVINRQQPPWKDLIGDSFKLADGVKVTILPQQIPPCPYCGTSAYCECGTPL